MTRALRARADAAPETIVGHLTLKRANTLFRTIWNWNCLISWDWCFHNVTHCSQFVQKLKSLHRWVVSYSFPIGVAYVVYHWKASIQQWRRCTWVNHHGWSMMTNRATNIFENALRRLWYWGYHVSVSKWWFVMLESFAMWTISAALFCKMTDFNRIDKFDCSCMANLSSAEWIAT